MYKVSVISILLYSLLYQSLAEANFIVLIESENNVYKNQFSSIKIANKSILPGDKLQIGSGIFRESDIKIQSGSSKKPIIISGKNSDTVITDYIPDFYTPSTNSWEIYDVRKNIYRSVNMYEVNSRYLHGKVLTEGEEVSLIVYKNYAAFSSNIEYVTSEDRYLGPGIFYNTLDKHIYIRLQLPDPTVVFKTYTKPSNIDPGKNIIGIGSERYAFSFLNNAENIILKNFTIKGYYQSIRVHKGRNITFNNLTIIPGNVGIVIDDDSNEIYINNNKINGYYPRWVAWTDIKDSGGTPGLSALNRGVILNKENGNSPHHIFIKGNEIVGVFDGISAPDAVNSVKVTGNIFRVVDDAFQLGSSSYEIEFGNNNVIGPGVSHQGSGHSISPGTKYIHHNYFDVTGQTLWGRNDPDKILKEKYRGIGYHSPIPTHGSNFGNGDPWKIYNNTFVFNNNVGSRGVGAQLIGGRTSNATHEVYNNIFIVNENSYILRLVDISDQKELFAGNAYVQRSPCSSDVFLNFRFKGRDESFKDMFELINNPIFSQNLGEWGTSSEFYCSNSSIQSIIDLVSNGGVFLGDKAWPSVDNSIYRGMIKPSLLSN